MDLSYCVVNTNGRELLMRCLDAIERTHPDGVDYEILVLDNASDDGSAQAVEERRSEHIRVIGLDRRTGKAENDSTLLKEAQGRYALLLNEDAELEPNATRQLLDALESDPRAAVAASQLLDPSGAPQACAWRLPSVTTAAAGAVFMHRRLTVQSENGTSAPHPVGWAQSSAMLVRTKAAAEIGYLDPDFFVYSDETDFCKRLSDAGWRILLVPQARAIHHEQLSTDLAASERRIVEFHRNRDLYMRKHHGRAAALAVRVLTAWAYGVRALAAVALPGHNAARYRLHAVQALRPNRGQGIRDAAVEHNRRLSAAP